ncbi:DoxX family protein [Candidatus Spongiihabitans sp.]|uniref:DoxX family protein n=1 Tax=Candidatus Spongiihabitans sp. TaxID=3101308 RepID=UPI003C79B2BB
MNSVLIKPASLAFLRVSLGILMIFWGLDKLVNAAHSLWVANNYYLSLFATAELQHILGVIQIVLGLLVVAGLGRRYAYPVLLVVTGITLLSVWKSIIDPWGWYLEGAKVLYHPSLIIFAGACVLLAFRADDTVALDTRFAKG